VGVVWFHKNVFCVLVLSLVTSFFAMEKPPDSTYKISELTDSSCQQGHAEKSLVDPESTVGCVYAGQNGRKGILCLGCLTFIPGLLFGNCTCCKRVMEQTEGAFSCEEYEESGCCYKFWKIIF
jgi:hypothetical protein